MKCEIVFNFSFSATGQFSSNFDFNISAQIRTRSSEERQEVEQEVLALEAAHQHRIDGRRSPAGGDDVAPTNAEGEDVGESSGLAAGGDVSDDGSAAGNEMEQSNEVQSSSPESKKPKIMFIC